MMKFRIGFEIDAEALFGMLAKMLPIDNLSVEEIVPHHDLKAQIKTLGQDSLLPHKRTPTARKKRHSNGLDLKKGIFALRSLSNTSKMIVRYVINITLTC